LLDAATWNEDPFSPEKGLLELHIAAEPAQRAPGRNDPMCRDAAVATVAHDVSDRP
jgi:hypothetical protein